MMLCRKETYHLQGNISYKCVQWILFLHWHHLNDTRRADSLKSHPLATSQNKKP